MERNLCDRVDAELGFDEFSPVETAHFRTFSMFWQSGTFEAFESEWEGRDRVKATEFQ